MPDTPNPAPATGDEPTTPETPTPPETPAPETPETPAPETETETPETPEGAEKPDAVKNALDKERKAARDARTAQRAAEGQLREARETIATLTQERDDATAKLPELENEVADLRAQLDRYEVAESKGLSLKVAKRLTGSTRDELETDADEVASLFGTPADVDFDGGPRTPTPKKVDPEKAHQSLLVGLFGGSPSED